jgi:hypothetical protein
MDDDPQDALGQVASSTICLGILDIRPDIRDPIETKPEQPRWDEDPLSRENVTVWGPLALSGVLRVRSAHIAGKLCQSVVYAHCRVLRSGQSPLRAFHFIEERIPVMRWSAYEIFSILSGLSLIVLAFTSLPGDPARLSKDRVGGFVSGVAFVGYGWYTGHQTSGTFFFPIWIFVIPFGVVGVVIASAISRSGQEAAKADTGTAPASRSSSTALAPGQAQPTAVPGNAVRKAPAATAPRSPLRLAAAALCVVGVAVGLGGLLAGLAHIAHVGVRFGHGLLITASVLTYAAAVALACAAAWSLNRGDSRGVGLRRIRAAAALFVVAFLLSFIWYWLVEGFAIALTDYVRPSFEPRNLLDWRYLTGNSWQSGAETLGWFAWVAALLLAGAARRRDQQPIRTTEASVTGSAVDEQSNERGPDVVAQTRR